MARTSRSAKATCEHVRILDSVPLYHHPLFPGRSPSYPTMLPPVAVKAIVFLLMLCLLPAFYGTGYTQQSFSGIFQRSAASHIYLYDISWDDLQQKNKLLGEDNYVLIDVETLLKEGRVHYWAIWKESKQSSSITQVQGWENLLKQKEKMAAQGMIIQEIENFLDPSGQEVFVVAWGRGSCEQLVVEFDSWEQLELQTKELGSGFFQLTDIETLEKKQGNRTFLALYQKQPPNEKGFPVMTSDSKTFYQNKVQRNKSGYALVDYETFKENENHFFIGLYKKAQTGENCRYQLDWRSFVAHQKYLGQEYKLADLEISQDDGSFTAPPFYTERLDQMPNISHQAITAYLPAAKASEQTAPCAAANALAWLSERGFPELDPARSSKESVKQITQKLANTHYMNSLKKGGPDFYAVTKGLVNYIENHGYEVGEVSVLSNREVDRRKLQVPLKSPSEDNSVASLQQSGLRKVKEGLVGNGIVLIGWGVYEPVPEDSTNERFQKIGTYWGTVAGYGVNEHGNTNPDVLIVHSPVHNSQKPIFLHVEDRNPNIKLTSSGKLIDPEANPQNSTLPVLGQKYLRNAMHQEGKRFAVWEHILVVKLKNKELLLSEQVLRQE